ncbi:MAG TPA: 2,3-bisphosphoglycerate-independent phosphoglycerate mutase [Oscillospiraceae bacterium]|nr:2,3-bisphosphoglycerate-independent phosphoglycerate mutase [Oscillospiraceae bacterium]HPD89690.1 2,3-bisphosphoglycerate-independent phosphoglycerate mutase [Oscillospiraceae bacterium]HRW57320.1 2,3-bisphosphoglycerate-independent phosphoglycerate mutase [Oscillospiraceae bacterium]
MNPLVLMILDGFGYNPSAYGNAVRAARMPNLGKILAECPHTLIGASGMDVGLPEGQMGNSEVGHTNIGAGRIVYQELTRITKAIEDGELQKNEALLSAMKDCLKKGTALHLMGLLSDGGVHSHIRHLFGLLDMAKALGLKKIYVHCFLDGRDTPPSSGKGYVEELEAKLSALGVGSIADCGGRYYGMDRDKRWDRVKKHYDTLLLGEGERCADAAAGIQASYDAGVTDEFVVPFVCDEAGRIKDGDSVIFFNFRPDRAREITRALCDPDFDGFERPESRPHLHFVCMTQYDATIPGVEVAFPPEKLKNTFGSYISEKGLCQLRIAETEKYAHVTFFFNGGVEEPYKNESRDLIPSPKVATYDLQPEMSAYPVTDKLLEELDSGKYDVVILNYANCDMVGHTGVFEAAVKACEAVDECLGKITAKVKELGGAVLITADHGNADVMLAPDGTPFTAHSTNPVPFIVFNRPCQLRENGRLADIAPTMLKLLGLPQPLEMTGKSLITD